MNPNAKEFVPAHLMRKRQDEAAVGSLAKQLDDVDLDESKRVGEGKGDTSCDNQQNSAETSSRNDKAQDQTSNKDEDTNNKVSADLNKDQNSTTTTSSSSEQCHKAQHNSYTNQTNERSKNNHEINGGQDEDDRYLLRAGENYCEFNGEQFIIPGEDDEYDTENDNQVSDNSHPVYDFGNPEDNEDENVINAYDEFLSELP